MRRFSSYITLLFALQLTACPSDSNGTPDETLEGDEDDDAANGPEQEQDDVEADGEEPGDEQPGVTDPDGNGDEQPGEDGDGDGDGLGGDPPGDGTDPLPADLCALFHEGWAYEVATYYEPGEEPIVVSVSGDADFRADGTYEQNYYIGSIGNFYSGEYVIEGDRLTTYDEQGDVVFEYRYTCGDELRELVLTLENEDGTPSIIFGLQSLAD